MKKSSSTDAAAERFFEDQLYARVYEEIESGQMDKAAQARAIAEGGGDDGAVKRAYIKHRMDRIKAELIAEEQAAIAEEQAAQERAKAKAQAKRERARLENRNAVQSSLRKEWQAFRSKKKVLVNILICYIVVFVVVVVLFG
jgi:hypothetical protein